MYHNFHHSSVDRLVGFFHVSRLFVVVLNMTSAALSILNLFSVRMVRSLSRIYLNMGLLAIGYIIVFSK